MSLSRFFIVVITFLYFSATSAWAVVVNITGVSGGEPVPGTTISLETSSGEAIPLEIVSLDDITLEEEVDNAVQDTTTAAESTIENVVEDNAVSEITDSDTTTIAGSDDEKRNAITVAAVPVNSTGNVSFVVGDQYKDEEVVLVIRDASGNVIDRKKVFLAGEIITANIAQLADAFTTGGRTARTVRPASEQTFAQTSGSSGDSSDALDTNLKANYSISGEFEYGRLKRDTFNALRLQSGGGATILQDNFASHSRSSDFRSFAVEGYGDLNKEAPFYGTNLYVIGGARHATSSSSSYDMNVLSDGADLGILSPYGPTGGLGGGVNVNAPNADLNFVRYHDNYSETLVSAGLMTMIEHGNFTFTKGASLFYGRTTEELNYSGRTNSNTLDFGYNVNTDTNRIGLQLSMEAETMVAPQLNGYAGLDLRFVRNHSNSDAILNLSGALNATESASTSANKLDVGAVLEGGLRYKQGRNSLDFGGRFETWQVAVPRITGEQPLYIDYESRNSLSGYFKFVRTF